LSTKSAYFNDFCMKYQVTWHWRLE